MVDEARSDYDSAWKEALTVYFEPFMAFCFPDTHRDINWERGYETLDTELQDKSLKAHPFRGRDERAAALAAVKGFRKFSN